MVGSFGEVQVMDWGLAKVLPRGGAGVDDESGKESETVIATARSGEGSESDHSQAGSVMGTPAWSADTDGSPTWGPRRSEIHLPPPRIHQTGSSPAPRAGRNPRADTSGGREAPLPSRSLPSPHPTQNESPARPAAVLFWKNVKNSKSKTEQ